MPASNQDDAPDDDARRATSADATMRLRADPPRVTRLSRKVLVSLGTAVSVGIGGALVYSLKLHRADKPNEELYSTTSRSQPAGLNSLPTDYTGPLLGQPLPGDLGRSIFKALNRGRHVHNPSLEMPLPRLYRTMDGSGMSIE